MMSSKIHTVVVFPVPLGPKKAKISPCSIKNEILLIAFTFEKFLLIELTFKTVFYILSIIFCFISMKANVSSKSVISFAALR